MRVLIISKAAPFGGSATGLTVGSLFQEWDPAALGVLTAEPECLPARGFGVTLGWSPAAPVTRLQHGLRRFLGESDLAHDAGTIVGLARGHGESGRVSIRVPLRETARALRDLTVRGVPGSLLRQVDSFKPDIIYSTLGDLSWSHVTAVVGRASGVPVVPHFMDDWPHTLYSAAYPQRFWRRTLAGGARRSLLKATVGLAICSAMADEYAERYGMPFEAFMRCLRDIHPFSEQKRPPVGPVQFIYFGGLHLGRVTVLAAVARALDLLSSHGITAALRILSPSRDVLVHGARLRALKSISSVESASPAAGEAVLRRAAVAVHVESFDARAAAYTRLSISTKIPSYLRAGLPVVAVGPHGIASTAYVSANQVGVAIHRTEPEAIAAELAAVLSRRGWLETASRCARRLFLERHDAGVVRKAFHDTLATARSVEDQRTGGSAA